MRYMLDTNILIYLIKQRPPEVVARVAGLRPDDALCMSFVSWAELLKGAERSSRPEQARRRFHLLADSIPVLYQASHAMCSHHAKFAALMKDKGSPIGANDLWIAAHAMAEGCTLVTNNMGEFGRLPGLRLENWAVV